jgi:hypothetical protein
MPGERTESPPKKNVRPTMKSTKPKANFINPRPSVKVYNKRLPRTIPSTKLFEAPKPSVSTKKEKTPANHGKNIIQKVKIIVSGSPQQSAPNHTTTLIDPYQAMPKPYYSPSYPPYSLGTQVEHHNLPELNGKDTTKQVSSMEDTISQTQAAMDRLQSLMLTRELKSQGFVPFSGFGSEAGGSTSQSSTPVSIAKVANDEKPKLTRQQREIAKLKSSDGWQGA